MDNQKTGISAWVLGPILFMILMAGPVGYLAYLVTKAIQQARKS